MINTIIQVFFGECVGDAGEMDHGIAVLQKGLPVEWNGQIWESGKDYIGSVKSGRCP